MSSNSTGILNGMRDYFSLEWRQRDFIVSTIRSVYQRYGFEPLETPAIERSSTLTEKYGDDGEQLIFYILKSGNFLQNINCKEKWVDYLKVRQSIANKALRYDLTIPLIRFIASNRHKITFPLRRYQIQPVWRADRPQKGRYREFLQCDVDIVGSSSYLCEVEILKLVHDVLESLQIRDICIKVNHRGILSAIAGTQGNIGQEQVFCTIVDKLEKLGIQAVIDLLLEKGFGQDVVDTLVLLSRYQGDNAQLLEQLKSHFYHTEFGLRAIEELEKIINRVVALGIPRAHIRISPTLARGINYYTGLVVEATTLGSSLGSLGGGGRYDDIGTLFHVPNLSGVGFSFGVDRLHDAMGEQGLFQDFPLYTSEVLVTNIAADRENVVLQILNDLRKMGIKSEAYLDQAKLKKQLEYANKKHIPFVIILGKNDLSSADYILKNMCTGEQFYCGQVELYTLLRQLLNV